MFDIWLLEYSVTSQRLFSRYSNLNENTTQVSERERALDMTFGVNVNSVQREV